jgi:hypothetical protein
MPSAVKRKDGTICSPAPDSGGKLQLSQLGEPLKNGLLNDQELPIFYAF